MEESVIYNKNSNTVVLKRLLLDSMDYKTHSLLFHLKPKELILFLISDDFDRKIMLSKNPPNIEQRYMAGISEDGGLMSKWYEKLNIASSPWNYDLGPITTENLRKSLEKMRKNSNSAGKFSL